MTDLLPALAQHLATRGHGIYSTTNPYSPGDVAIVLGAMPSAPDRCVVLTPSTPPESNTAEEYDLARIRIRLRDGVDYAPAAARVAALYDELHGVGVTAWGDLLIVNCVAVGVPTWAGLDEVGRHEQVLTVRVEYRNPHRTVR